MTVRKKKKRHESAATRAKISKALKAYHKKHPAKKTAKGHRKGHPESAATKAKIAAALKRYYKTHPRKKKKRKPVKYRAVHRHTTVKKVTRRPRARSSTAGHRRSIGGVTYHHTDRAGPKIAGHTRRRHETNRAGPQIRFARSHLRVVRTSVHHARRVHTIRHEIRRAAVVRFRNPISHRQR